MSQFAVGEKKKFPGALGLWESEQDYHIKQPIKVKSSVRWQLHGENIFALNPIKTWFEQPANYLQRMRQYDPFAEI